MAVTLTPGHDDKQARAEQHANEATAAWRNLVGQTGPDAPGGLLTYGIDVQPFAVGKPLTTAGATESFMNPNDAEAAGLMPTSEAYRTTTAFDNLGPSAYQDATSAFGNLGPSAASGLGFNPQDLARMGSASDYFQNLSKTGNDPIAEADYQRRVMQAEQGRKANTDAALAAMEAKGLGNAGGQLAARLTGNQDEANARYQAGLDATAMAAGRRDTAAGTGASIASQMGQNQFGADAAKAAALDKYNQAKAAGADDFTARRASGLDQFSTGVASGKDAFNANMVNAADAWNNQRYNDWYQTQKDNADRQFTANTANFNRGNTVADTNTGNWNATAYHNKVDVPQTKFGNTLAATTGFGNASLGAANTLNNAAANPGGFGAVGQLLGAGGAAASGTGQLVSAFSKPAAAVAAA